MDTRISITGLTPSIQVNNNLGELPCDALDNTTAAVVKDAKSFPTIATELEKIGGKRFLLASRDVDLNGTEFKSSAESSFQRVYYCSREELQKSTNAILQSHPELTQKIMSMTHVAKTEEELTQHKNRLALYKEIHKFIKQNAGFTFTKMEEYSQEEVPGKLGRYQHQHITPVVLLDDEKEIIGNIRSLDMGEEFAYLSDETIDMSLSLPGIPENDNEKIKFLLAFLMNQACQNLPANQKEFLIIAAAGREKIYEGIGFKKFPKNHSYDVFIRLGAPTQELNKAKEIILNNAKTRLENLKQKTLKQNQWALIGLFGVAVTTVVAGVVKSTFSRNP